MQVFKKFILVSIIIIFLLIFSSNNVFADTTIKPPIDTIEITIAVVIAAIAFILTFIFFGGIKYVTPENVLNTEIRKNLYNYIDNFPGSHLREIARELDLKPSNAAWHLRKLEQTNLVRSRTIGGKKVILMQFLFKTLGEIYKKIGFDLDTFKEDVSQLL